MLCASGNRAELLELGVASELGITYAGEMDVYVFMASTLNLKILGFTIGSEKVCCNEANVVAAAQGELKQSSVEKSSGR